MRYLHSLQNIENEQSVVYRATVAVKRRLQCRDEGYLQTLFQKDNLLSTERTPASTTSYCCSYQTITEQRRQFRLQYKSSAQTRISLRFVGCVRCVLKPVDEPTDTLEATLETETEPEDVVEPVSDFGNDPRMEGVYEKLIELYRSRDRRDWKKLITLSTKWPEMADGVFERSSFPQTCQPH